MKENLFRLNSGIILLVMLDMMSFNVLVNWVFFEVDFCDS